MRTEITTLGERDVEQLLGEIERYLEVVEVFRTEGFEPSYLDDEWLWRLSSHVLPA